MIFFVAGYTLVDELLKQLLFTAEVSFFYLFCLFYVDPLLAILKGMD